MKNEKLKSLQLRTGVHTVCVRTKCIPKFIPKNLRGCVKNTEINLRHINGVEEYVTIINPNRYGEINSLADFDRIMVSIMQELEIDSYMLTRVDFSIDNLEIRSYNKYLKIMKLVIMIIAMDHDTKTFYQSFNPLTFKALTIRMDAELFSIEYYDKYEESGGDDPAQARLELRSKRLSKTGRSVLEEKILWCVRLRALPKSIKKLEDLCNEVLANIWKEEFASGKVKSKSEFIRKYQSNIFTVKQLKDLCQLLGSAERYADEIKSKSNIETFTELDLKEFIELIVEGLDNFTAKDS